MGSLPRSLWPHHVVVYVRSLRPAECTMTPGPLAGNGETRGETLHNIRVSILEISRQRSTLGRRRSTATNRQGSQRQSAPGRRETITKRFADGRIDLPWYNANGVHSSWLSTTSRESRETPRRRVFPDPATRLRDRQRGKD